MHRCFSIAEVQRTVFCEIYKDKDDPDHLTTLAGLARTCRAFHNVALDVLWAKLDSFDFLIKCLPRDLWKIKTSPKGSGIVIFRRPMSRRDWEVFFKHSTRVRILRQYDGGESLSDDVIVALSNPPTFGPLIPYLKELSWGDLNRKYASLVRLLLSPSLTSLHLRSYALHSFELSILSPIGTSCSSLKHLTITPDDVLDANDKKILSDMILNLHLLESLECPTLNEAATAHIYYLPSLAKLTLEQEPDFQVEKLLPHLMPSVFASLHTLQLNASSLQSLIYLLKPLQFTPEKLSFNITNTPTPDTFRLFFLALVTACGSKKLSHLALVTHGKRHPHLRRKIMLSTFQSLLAVSSILTFYLEVPCDIVLDDEAIKTLTTCWPKLNELHLNGYSGWGVVSCVTPKGLIMLLSRCADLTFLAIAIDFTSVDMPFKLIPKVRPGRGATNRNCEIIYFLTSIIRYPDTIAAFLSDICPELRIAGSLWHEDATLVGMEEENLKEIREKWKEVENLLPGFIAVRRQCMDWAERSGKKGRMTLA